MAQTQNRGYPLIDPTQIAQIDAVNPALEEIDADMQSAITAADAAQTTADAAQSAADAAQSTATRAENKADAAQTTADAAQSAADAAQSTATRAENKADAAQTTADAAQSAATRAENKADSAQTTADAAQSAATRAENKADAAQTTAGNAVTTADTANSKSDGAVSTANAAKAAAEKASADVADLAEQIGQQYAKIVKNTAAWFDTNNPVLESGQFGYSTTDGVTKIGDGVTTWKNLKVFATTDPDIKIIYGVKISRSNSNPATAVTYTDDATGFAESTAATDGSWADKFPFNQIKPCLLNGGSVVGYLNKNDFTKFENGSAADIATVGVGDVMIEFPKIYYKISQDASYTYVQISNAPQAGFTDWAYSYKGSVKNKFYIGAYKGYATGSKLYSLSGKAPTVNQNIDTFRNYAQARGAGYEQMPFNKLILLQALFIIRYKSLNSQSALGAGYTGGSAAQSTGATNANGMNYGASGTTTRVKFCGIEDFWGNIYEWVEGLIQNDYGKILVKDGNFSSAYSGFTQKKDTAGNDIYGYIKDVCATNELGFLIADCNGSSSTYYSDYGEVGVDSDVLVPIFGGDWSGGTYAGAFYLYLGYDASSAYSTVGSRLCFCG